MQVIDIFQIRRKIMLIHMMTYIVMVSNHSNKTGHIFIQMLYNPQVGNRPSEYLRERCPLCFGGVNWQQPKEMLV